MAILSKGTTYSDGDQVTSTNLNALVDSATFASGAVDDSTTQLSSGKIIVKDLGIATGKLAASAVTTAKIANSNVTKAKIENVANLKVLGNVSGSAAAPAEVAILDEDNMASNSATSLSTQQSIKAYADSKVDGTGAGSFTTLAASGVVSVADGSESAPAITNTGDTNTGIYFPAENSVALTAGAGATLTSTNTAITIDVPTSIVSTAQSDLTLQGGDANSKNLIFKKASAQQGKISAAGDELKFYAGTSGTETLELTTTQAVVTGNLGIGVTPSHKLHVNSGATNQVALFESTDETAVIELADSTGSVQFITLGSGDLRIATGGSAGGGGSPASGLYITQGQDVGIGDDTPSYKLDVNGTGRFTGVLSAGSNLDVTGTLAVSGDAAFDTDTLFVDVSADRVGINDSTPSVALDVTGEFNLTSHAKLGANLSLKKDTDAWSTDTWINVTDYGVINHGGSFALTINGNGYRGTDGWTSFGKGSSDGATQIWQYPQGYITFNSNDSWGTTTDGTNKVVTERMRIHGDGNVSIGTTSASEKLTVSGNVSISGSLSKGSGSFKIPHPLESKRDTHNLVHSFLESPQADLIYRGRVDLVDGVASVNIDVASDMTDGTFVLLCRDVQSFTTNESGWTAVRSSVYGNILTIEAQDNTCTDSISWMVVGERQDQHMYDTEWTDENGKVVVEPLIPEPIPEPEEELTEEE